MVFCAHWSVNLLVYLFIYCLFITFYTFCQLFWIRICVRYPVSLLPTIPTTKPRLNDFYRAHKYCPCIHSQMKHMPPCHWPHRRPKTIKNNTTSQTHAPGDILFNYNKHRQCGSSLVAPKTSKARLQSPLHAQQLCLNVNLQLRKMLLHSRKNR